MRNRRSLLVLLGAAGLSPRVVLAQSKQPLVIAWLSPNSRETGQGGFAAFKEELAALGWKEGSQVLFEGRWTDGQRARLPVLADELAAKNPALIVATSLPVAAAAAKAAPKTAIVVSGADMVAAGLAKSLARPGGLITGITNMSGAIAEKYLELLLAAVPQLKRVGFLAGDPSDPASREYMDAARRSAARLTVEGRFADVVNAEDIEPAIARLAKEGAQALVVFANVGPFMTERQRIVKLALANRWPVIARSSGWAMDGALLSYGVDGLASTRRLAHYADRILKGAKPADLPIEQPTKFELVINMKTARALGITIPQSILVRADRVIE